MIKIRREELEETTQNTSIHSSEPVTKHIKVEKDTHKEKEEIKKLKKFYGIEE